MSTLYRPGDVVQPSSAHDPALSGIVADVLAAEAQPCPDGRAREIVTVRVRSTGFVAQLDAGELTAAPLDHSIAATTRLSSGRPLPSSPENPAMVIPSADDELTSQPRCSFCGEAERIEIWEIWSDHDFTLGTCCAALLEHVSAEMHHDPRWARDLLCRLGAEALTGHRLRRVTDGEGSHPMLDFQLRIAPVRFAVAQTFIARHHGHRPPPVTWRWGASVWNGPTMLGVVTVGNPVARAFMHRGIVEVNRLCIRRDVPALLRWNGASVLYACASREAERLGFSRIVTYTREDEEGTSLRAAGWTCEGPAGGHSWISATRPNRSASGWVPKLRWSRALRPRMPATARAQRPQTQKRAEPLWLGEWDVA